MSEIDEKLLLRLKENDPSLPRAILSWSNIGAEGAKALADVLVQNDTVENLLLARCLLGNRGTTFLAGVLRVNRAITHLDLQGNGIGDEGAMALAGALRHNDTLTHILLMNNNIGPTGVAAIMDSVCRPDSAVKYLILSSNRIGPDGAKAVARALCHGGSRRIEYLELGTNQIDDVGATFLAHALSRHNVHVQHLDLSWNDLGARGYEALASALCYNVGAVPHLTLDGNRFDEKDSSVAVKAFAELVERDPSRTQLNLKDVANATRHCSNSKAIDVRQDDEIQLIHNLVGISLWGMKRKDLLFLLGKVATVAMSRLAQESHKVQDHVVPELLQRVGATVGINGLFSCIRTRPELFDASRLRKCCCTEQGMVLL